jgi:flagellar biosynthesis protein FlhF
MLDNKTTKTIEAETYDDCIRLIRNECGNNFNVASKKEKPVSGLRRLFGASPKYEVSYYETTPPVRLTVSPVMRNDEEEKRKLLNLTGKMPNPQLLEISKKLELMENSLTDRIDAVLENALAATSAQGEQTLRTDHPVIAQMTALLEANEYSPALIRTIAGRLRRELSFEQLGDEAGVRERVAKWLAETIKILPPPQLVTPPAPPLEREGREAQTRVVALVGPTGEGKTTTITKLALQARCVNPEARIALMTTDRFRIGAEDQIQKYAGALELDYFPAENAEAVRAILRDHPGTYDLLRVDTTGCSAFDFEAIGKTRQILELPELHPDIYLVVSASKKTGDLKAIFDSYATFKYRALIVTKMDETRCLGNVVSALADQPAPIVYVSDGQHFKDTLKPATAATFLRPL